MDLILDKNLFIGAINDKSSLAKLEIVGGYTNTGGGSGTPIMAIQYYDNGGYRHFIRSRHNGTTSQDTGNALDFYLNKSSTASGSSAPGTGNELAMSITGKGVGVFNTAPSTALQVNGVIKSTIPSWMAYKESHNNQTAGSVVIYNVEKVTAQNCTFNAGTGTMTATVAGRYFIFFHGFAQDGTTEVWLQKNSTDYIRHYGDKSGTYEAGFVLNAIMDLAVNDTVRVRVGLGALHGNGNCSFGGYMIG